MKKKSAYLEKRVNELFGSMMVPVLAEPTDEDASAKVYADDFDIVKLMEEAKDPDTGIIRDLKIDDRDLKVAKNYYDFAFTTIGKDAHPPWLIQMWIGLLMFGEICPVCSDKRWLNLSWIVENVDRGLPSIGITEHLKILKNGVCPKCKRHKWELIEKHGLNNYTELVNCLGQRSGKSASAASYSAYVTHRYLKFPKLAELTSAMQKSTELTGTFVSLTFAKALSLLWVPFKNIIDDSTWFSDYFAMLDAHAEKYGIELYRRKDEYLKFYHKSFKFYPASPLGPGLRGDTRILAAIDELGLFRLPTSDGDEDEKLIANADEVHKSLTNSLVTVQQIRNQLLKQDMNPPPAMMIGVSSPMSHRDKVMRLLEDSRTETGRKQILGVNLPTWKVNPHLDRNSDAIAMAYARNAEKAERDFGANPPRVHNTFMKATQVPQKLWVVKNTHKLTYCYDQPGELYGKVELFYRPKYPSVVCLDAGVANNSFTLSGAHFDFERQKTVLSTLIEIMTHDGRRIDFNSTYLNVILPIMRDINAVCLFADQWQSLDILSRAKSDMGTATWAKGGNRCITKQYSPKRSDFDALVAMLESGAYELPFLAESEYQDVVERAIEYRTLNGKPEKHLLLQMLTVADQGPGRAPTKGAGFTDDLFRSMVLTTLIHKERVFERLKLADVAEVSEKRKMPMPIFVRRSF